MNFSQLFAFTILTLTLSGAPSAFASGSHLPNSGKRMEWSKASGIYTLDAPHSSASCDKDTQIEVEVLETDFEREPTAVFHNLTNGVRAGRPRHVFSRINQGEDEHVIDGIDGKHLEVIKQERTGWTLTEKRALFRLHVDFNTSLPKNYSEINWEFDLLDQTLTSCQGLFEYKFPYNWKSVNYACAQMTPIAGPCTYKKN